MKIYTNMCKLWVHPAYEHWYIFPLPSKYGKFQPQTNIFLVNNSHLTIKPTVALVKISEKSPNHSLANRKKHILLLKNTSKL